MATNITLLGRRFLAVTLATLILLPGSLDLSAQAPRAGEVAAQIPAGQIERPSGALPSDVGTAVLWQDLVTTAPRGRVRIGLDDGSILNVGSNGSLRVVQHDASTHQSELVLIFGQMRVRTQLRGDDPRFTVRTNTAIIGVIGTDFWVQALATETRVIVFEGAVRVTSLVTGLGTVLVGAGQQTIVGSNQPPAQPSSPSASEYQAAIEATEVGEPLPEPPGPRRAARRSKLPWILAVVGVAATIVVVVIIKRRDGSESPSPPSSPGPG